MNRTEFEYFDEHEKTWKEYFLNANMANIAWFFVGAIAGTSFIGLLLDRFKVEQSFFWSAVITISLICLKEFLDEVTKYTLLKGKWGLDPAGADARDILLGVVGIAFTLLLI